MNISKEYFLAARGKKRHGGAIFTLEIPMEFRSEHGLPNHYTYKVKYKSDSFGEKWFVSLLTGPDNTSNYSYVGLLNPDTGELLITNGSKISGDAWSVRLIRRVFACLWSGKTEKLLENDFDCYHNNNCSRCCKVLTTPESVLVGYGPICAKFIGN